MNREQRSRFEISRLDINRHPGALRRADRSAAAPAPRATRSAARPAVPAPTIATSTFMRTAVRNRYARGWAVKNYLYFRELARPEGFEPPTPTFVALYSIQLSYGRALTNRTQNLRDRTGPGFWGPRSYHNDFPPQEICRRRGMPPLEPPRQESFAAEHEAIGAEAARR
jgi:hypothetical protein